ncbi:MAG: HNH endonuclease [Rhodococcus sp. (in: high G+C Gram-positive bacteria)]|uniref:HNH endonuclease n=1 Tax=Rhodococcus sp. EPR-157 TaxID=1813677 RepID=UPI002F917C90
MLGREHRAAVIAGATGNRSNDGATDLANLVLLCGDCHRDTTTMAGRLPSAMMGTPMSFRRPPSTPSEIPSPAIIVAEDRLLRSSYYRRLQCPRHAQHPSSSARSVIDPTL